MLLIGFYCCLYMMDQMTDLIDDAMVDLIDDAMNDRTIIMTII